MNERYDEENLYVSKYRNDGGGGGGGSSSAQQVTYDDSETHLNAANVQEAIEAVTTRCATNSRNIETLTANKQDKLTQGNGIIISNNTISVNTAYDSVNESLTIGI